MHTVLSDIQYGIRMLRRTPGFTVTVSVALTATALLASYIPAWRAARVDPVITLRQQ